LTRGGRLLAVAYLEYHREPPPDSQGYLHTLPLLCLHAATVLNQATVTRELDEATRVLDAAFERLPVGLILLGPDLTVHRASPHACQLTRLPIRRGTPIAEIFDVLRPADTRQAPFAFELALAVAGADQDERIQQTVTLVQPAGPRIRLHACALPLRRPDRTLFGIALLLSEVNATDNPW
jgi:GAF domain-containing protein